MLEEVWSFRECGRSTTPMGLIHRRIRGNLIIVECAGRVARVPWRHGELLAHGCLVDPSDHRGVHSVLFRAPRHSALRSHRTTRARQDRGRRARSTGPSSPRLSNVSGIRYCEASAPVEVPAAITVAALTHREG